MELTAVIEHRRMTRRFRPAPVDDEVLRRVLGVVGYAPSAGNTKGVELLALCSAARREAFWALATDATWRAEAPDAPGLMAAPVIVLPIAEPDAYASRYAAPDKLNTQLGGLPADEWPVPYWTVDTAFAAMLVLLAAEQAGLGALFFQLHNEQAVVLAGLGVPGGRLTIGAIALGHPAPGSGRPSQGGRPIAELVHLDDYPR